MLISVRRSAETWLPVSEVTFACDALLQIKPCVFSLTGTFGRIFHGVLVDEKDPTKEKQVFVKTVKGMFNVRSKLCHFVQLTVCQLG